MMTREKRKLTLVLGMVTLWIMLIVGQVMAVSPDNYIYVPVFMTVTDGNGKTFENNEIVEFKAGDKIYVSAYCNNAESKAWAQNSNFMEDWGFKVNGKGMAIISYMFDSTDSKNYTRSSDPTQLTITIPNYPVGSKHYVVIDAVAAIDGLPTDDGKEYSASSGTFAIKFTMGESTPVKPEPLTGSIAVAYQKGALSTSAVNELDAGTQITLTGTPAQNFLQVKYSWDGGAQQAVNGANATVVVPNFTAGTEHTLRVTGTLTDGTVVSEKVYRIRIPNYVVSLSGTVQATLDQTVLTPNSTYTITGGEQLKVAGTPAENFMSLRYRWDNGSDQTISAAAGSISLPGEEGRTYELKVYGLLTNGTTTDVKTYYFKVAERPQEEEEELEIEPWMRENSNADGLLVSLRNDSAEEKENKNFYMLNEEVIYYVDYKNAGKDIDDTVKLVLRLPLDFKIVDAEGGTVSHTDNTITWTFENGLEEDVAGTKVVTIKYTAFTRKSYDYEMIYPQADIYKANRKMDSSAVINFIYEDEDTVIGDEHDPYMYGDREKPTFRPDDTITRAEGALVLVRIFGVSTSNTKVTNQYSDIQDTYLEAQKAITVASQLGIINGYKDGTYRPNDTMTRAEFMKIIASYIEVLGEEEGVDGLEVKSENNIKVYYNSSYRDHWAIDYVTLLTRLNMTDVSARRHDLRLDSDITRAEVAQLINFYSFRAPAKVTASTKSGFTDVSRNHALFADIIEATRETHEYSITEDGREKAE